MLISKTEWGSFAQSFALPILKMKLEAGPFRSVFPEGYTEFLIPGGLSRGHFRRIAHPC